MVIFLFSDCLIVAVELMNKYQCEGVTVLDEHSRCYAKQDLKYYRHLLKITGKDTSFILFGSTSEA